MKENCICPERMVDPFCPGCNPVETNIRPLQSTWNPWRSSNGFSCYTCGSFCIDKNMIPEIEKDCLKCGPYLPAKKPKVYSELTGEK